jgi:hypothetical protein
LGVEYPDPLSANERLGILALGTLITTAIFGLQWRQRHTGGITGWVGLAISLAGLVLMFARFLGVTDAHRWLVLGALLLTVGLLTSGSAAIDGEAPIRWRRVPALLGVVMLVALPLILFGSAGALLGPFAVLPLAFGVLLSLLGYSVATERPAEPRHETANAPGHS